jgi:hypothetical protein
MKSTEPYSWVRIPHFLCTCLRIDDVNECKGTLASPGSPSRGWEVPGWSGHCAALTLCNVDTGIEQWRKWRILQCCGSRSGRIRNFWLDPELKYTFRIRIRIHIRNLRQSGSESYRIRHFCSRSTTLVITVHNKDRYLVDSTVNYIG